VTASRPVVRALGLTIVAVLLAGVVAVVVEGGDGVPRAGARVTVNGRATVVHIDGSTDRLTSGDVVRAGEEVRVDEGGVVLDLAEGGTLEGRAGHGDTPATRVVVEAQPELVSGELLVLGDPGLSVDAAGTVVAVGEEGSAAKLARGLAVTAGAYEGGREIDSAGQQRSVPALRQLGIATLGRPPGSPEPIELSPADAWDRRFLGGAIDLGRRLDSLSTAFTFQTSAGAARSAGVFRAVLPAAADEADLPGLLRTEPDRPAGEVLVGLTMVTLAGGGSFVDRWRAVFDFREEGADWGVVALDQDLEADAVLAAVQGAVGRADATPDVALTPPTTPPRTTPTTPGTTAPPPTTPTSAPPTTPPPTTPPPTDPTVPTIPPLPPPPDDEVPDSGLPLLDDAIQPIEDLLSGLLE